MPQITPLCHKNIKEELISTEDLQCIYNCSLHQHTQLAKNKLTQHKCDSMEISVG